ncbi:MAG: hypothetical protein ABJC04_06920 [Verrucomicrobiota bacterium]
MNRDEAQKILAIFRPGTDDASDPYFKNALQLAARDTELKRWFETHCANYQTVRGALAQIAPPAALKEQILSERPVPSSRLEIISLPPFIWRRSVWAMAAVMVLFFGLAVYWFQPVGKNEYAGYRNRMVSAAMRAYGMDLETNDWKQIQTFLAKHQAPSDYSLPEKLRKSPVAGCVVLRWQDQPVSMICFRTGRPLPSGEKSDLFLFVADRAAFPKNFAADVPNLERINQVMTATWIDGGKLYLLATRGDEEFIRKFL